MPVKTFGFGRFLGFLEGTAAGFEAEAATLVAKTAFAIEADAKRLCPVDTGRLKVSIHPRFSRGGLTAVVGTNVLYAPFVEYGTGRRGSGKFKPIVKGEKKPTFGDLPGKPPQPYLRPAFHRHEKTFTRRGNEIIKRHWGGA